MQAAVDTLERQQFGMRADFSDAPLVHDHNAVGACDGREPVCDGERGAPTLQIVDRDLHKPFRFGVQRRGRLVEQKDGRILEQGAGN